MSALFKGVKSADHFPDLEFIPRVGIRQRPKHIRTHAEAIALGYQYMGAGMRASVTQVGESPIWRVEAQVEGAQGDPDQNIQNTHELRVNVLNPDIKANRVLQELFWGDAAPDLRKGVAAKKISFVHGMAREVEAGDLSYDEAVAEILSSTSIFADTDLDAARELLDELLLGADSYVEFQYVYVHTFNFGPLADLVSDYSNVGRIFTSAQVEEAENTPAVHVLPAGEWIKIPPERTDSLGSNTSIKYEYWWAEEYSRLRYLEAE